MFVRQAVVRCTSSARRRRCIVAACSSCAPLASTQTLAACSSRRPRRSCASSSIDHSHCALAAVYACSFGCLRSANDLRAVPLLAYSMIYATLVASVYGTHVPGGECCCIDSLSTLYLRSPGSDICAGLFVPSVIVGGAYGKVLGIALNAWVPGADVNSVRLRDQFPHHSNSSLACVA